MMNGTRNVSSGDHIFCKTSGKNQLVWKCQEGKPVICTGGVGADRSFRPLENDEWEPLPLVKDLMP